MNIEAVKLFTSLAVAFSLVISASFSGIDVSSIATFLHILEHDHHHAEHDHSHHDHVEHGNSKLSHFHEFANGHEHPSSSTKREKKSNENAFKMTSKKTNSSKSSEPHEHTINLVASMAALQSGLFVSSWPLLDPSQDVMPYRQTHLPSLYLDRLYRPPKC